MGRVLDRKTVAIDIIEHVFSQIKKKLLTKIIESKNMINVLADEFTRVDDKSTLNVFLRAKLIAMRRLLTFR